MHKRKIFLRIVSAMFFAVILLCKSVSHAEIKNYNGLGVYYLNNGETLDFGKKQAEILAERDILEQVKVYVRSDSRVVNLKLIEDEIIIISAGILRVIETKHVIETENDALIVKAFVIATVDTEELEILLENYIKKRQEESK